MAVSMADVALRLHGTPMLARGGWTTQISGDQDGLESVLDEAIDHAGQQALGSRHKPCSMMNLTGRCALRRPYASEGRVTRMKPHFRNLAAGALLLGATAFAGPSLVAADDDDDHDFGAYLYAATCGDLSTDAIIEDIGELEAEDDDDDVQEHWSLIGAGQGAPDVFYVEDEDVDNLTVEGLMTEPHAIAVHATDDQEADVIACGEITGTTEDGGLLIELTEVEDSGHEGRAYLAPDDDDDDDDDNDVEITVGLWSAGEVSPLGTPAS